MRETIVFAPGANAAELLRMLCRHGTDTFGLRILGSVQLARTALTRGGTAVTQEYITAREETAICAEIIKGIDYFKTASYSDAENAASAIRSLRRLIAGNEREVMEEALLKGEFPEKNAALLSLYERYMERLRSDNKTDGIMLVRMAINDAPALKNTEFVTLREYPLSPLDEALLRGLSGGRVSDLRLNELMKKPRSPVSIRSYIDAFGEINEAEAVLGRILEENYPLDVCTVAVTDTVKYSQLFYDLCGSYGIPVTFGCGVPITNSNPAALLRLISEWDTSGKNGTDALRAVVFCQAFDRWKLLEQLGCDTFNELKEVIAAAGKLRLSFDKTRNSVKINELRELLEQSEKADSESCLPEELIPERKILELTEKLAAEMEKGYVYLIETYSMIRGDLAGRVDRAALRAVKLSVEAYLSGDEEKDISAIIPAILGKNVCMENSVEGCLYVTGVDGAMCSLRQKLFIAGMSSSEFPGTPRENYLVLDSDYLLFGSSEDMPTSENIISGHVTALTRLVETACSLGNDVFISYCSFDNAELKKKNPSSVLFELYRAQHDGASIEEFYQSLKDNRAGYFEQRFGANRLIGKAYIDGRDMRTAETDEVETPAVSHDVFRWYPSAICTFVDCERKFYLQNVLRLKAPETDDPIEVMPARITGEIVHDMLRRLAENDMPLSRFLETGEKAFESYMKVRPQIMRSSKDKEMGYFRKMLENAYDRRDGEVCLAEKDVEARHPSGITLYGRLDRAERRGDGKYIVVDFKTGKYVTQRPNDYRTCLQTLLYAYMLKARESYDVVECQYRYIRTGQTVTCDYDEGAERFIDETLRHFKEALSTAAFNATGDKNTCGHCNFKDICGKAKA